MKIIKICYTTKDSSGEHLHEEHKKCEAREVNSVVINMMKKLNSDGILKFITVSDWKWEKVLDKYLKL